MYDPIAEEYYYGCTIVSLDKDTDGSGVHRKQTSARRDGEPVWMLGDSTYDMLKWHDHLLTSGIMSVVPYNARNSKDPKYIRHRVEDRIDKHSEDVKLKRSTLDETYNHRIGVERTNELVKDCGLRRTHAEVASTHEQK